MLIWLVQLARLQLITADPDPQDLVKALEFQYEQKIHALQLENAQLQNQVAGLKQNFKDACPVSYRKSLEPTSKVEHAAVEEPKVEVETEKPSPANQITKIKASEESTARELKVYREALRDINSENWNEAILSMETFVHNFPESDLADHAIYWIAQIYLQKGEIDLARTELKRLIELYPKGKRARRARAKLRELASSPKLESEIHLKISEPTIASGGKP